MFVTTSHNRRQTLSVNVGGIPLGSSFPVRVQSMVNTRTRDLEGSVAQCIRIIQAGADYVRFTIPSVSDVEAVAAIRRELRLRGYHNPVIADVHFNAEVALRVADHVDKVRINPGNFPDLNKFRELLEKCRAGNVAIRIGVNHGSLSERIMERYGDTPEGMAESAMEFLRICRNENFEQVVVSMKASNIRVMVQATRMVVEKMRSEAMDYPLHLGVTEAGEGEDGRIKSAAGIGTLLAEGLGDTIRVSLTEEPEAEIPVARKLVDHAGSIRQHSPDLHFSHSQVTGPCHFSKRSSKTAGFIGGSHPPVVVGADLKSSDLVHQVTVSIGELTESRVREMAGDDSAVLVFRCTTANVQAELRWLRHKLQDWHCDVPVIFQLHLQEHDPGDFQIKSAASLGGAFIDGFGDGIWLTNQFFLEPDLINSTAFGILQACRARMTRTEYISCPSCGRTNFNLMETVARVKAATCHLKTLKIGIMGCIVNGPGEMADADYGYVGTGKGKITLYKAKEVIKRGIPEENAVEELVNLIKANGDWVEP